MGSWGERSYDNDETYDLLPSRPDDATQRKMTLAISRAFNAYSRDQEDFYNCSKTAMLGTVIFALTLGHTVEKKFLKIP